MLQWVSDTFSDTLVGFANSIKTIDGGSHLDGLKAALTRLVNTAAKRNKVRVGRVCVCLPVSVGSVLWLYTTMSVTAVTRIPNITLFEMCAVLFLCQPLSCCRCCCLPSCSFLLPAAWQLVKEADPALSGDHVREGLSGVIAVKVPSPEFEGQTKTRLGNPEVW